MDLVAREASVARRTVYNQFESKEALFIASVERVWSEFPVVEITADESVLSDPAAGLKRIGDAVVERAFGIGPSALTEAMGMLNHHFAAAA
jgi:AcrR family transcriptional regulator